MATPAPPPGFVLDAPPPPKAKRIPPPPPGYELDATGEASDGDTFALKGGNRARLFGADAFELDQTGWRDGRPVPLGAQARNALTGDLPGATVKATGEASYGRPVVTIEGVSGDVGRAQIDRGLALPVPKYLADDPARLTKYVDTQRDAIAAERGAYAGTYQDPADYRQMGPAAPRKGKVPMTREQRQAFSSLVRNPKTTPAELEDWGRTQGQAIGNAENLLSFYRRNPRSPVRAEWNQTDVTGAAVVRDGPGIVTRHMGAWNEGIPDTLGFPVDLINSGMNALGVGSDYPVLGSEMIRDGMHWLGAGQADESYAPRSDVERYTQAAARGFGQAVVPVGGTIGAGGRLAARGASAITQASAPRMAVRNTLVDAARRPGVTVAGEVGAGIGSGMAVQAADDYAPGNEWLRAGAGVLGGLAGGLGGAGAVMARRPGLPAPSRAVMAPEAAPGAAVALPEPAASLAPSAAESNSAPPPAGFVLDAPVPARAAMAADPAPIQSAPVPGDRTPDRIDLGYVRPPPPPPGFVVDELPLRSDVLPPERPDASQLAIVARAVRPEDVTPIPDSWVGPDEVAALSDASRPPVPIPDERGVLEPFTLKGRNRRNPLDLISSIRAGGGIRDDAGELASMGLSNKARDLDFARDEHFLGPLINPKGATIEDAAFSAWEDGWLPQFSEPPTISEFLDAIDATARGGMNRVFHPDDADMLARYDDVQAERFRLEEAAQSGSPIYDELGGPASQADIEGNAAPVTAYEDLPRIGGRVGNINLAKLETRGDIRRALRTTEDAAGGLDAARRGKISHGETEALASELGLTFDTLMKRRAGQALNAEQALAARQLLAKSGDELVALAAKVKGGSDADQAEFRKVWLRHAAIQEQVTGATSEAGRALSQFRMAARSRAVTGQLHPAMIEGAGGKEKLEDVAEAILDLQRREVPPGAINSFALKASQPKWSDKLVELWYNSLLSGPQTHAVNVLSNALTAGLQIPEMATAALIGQARRQSVDRVMASELAPRAVGLLQGTREGLKAFARTLKTGEVPDFVTKVEARSQRAISGIKGEILRTPSRLLAAEDELFKAIGRRMEIAGSAMRIARGEGLKGPELYARVKALTDNPTDEMVERSLDYARYLTYQRPMGVVGQGISRMTQTIPALKLIVPFVRTPVNIMKFVAERSPAAPFVKEWRTDMRAGGARRDLAIARVALGTGLGLVVSQWAGEGKISGSGPLDDNARALMMADGWQPYSIRIGDTWHSYRRLDPIATTLGVAADFATRTDRMTDRQAEREATLVISSVLANLSDKTWLSGISDMVEAMNDPERKAQSFINRMIGSMAVPTLGSQIARTIDPVARDVATPVDAIRNRIPGMSSSLPSKRNVWGREIVSEGGIGPDIASPVLTRTAKNDPLNAEMLAIDARFGKPLRTVGGRRLSPTEFAEFQGLAGIMMETRIRDAMRAPRWSALPATDRKKAVDKIKLDARKAAKALLFEGGKSVKPAAKYDARRDQSALPPPPPGFVVD